MSNSIRTIRRKASGRLYHDYKGELKRDKARRAKLVIGELGTAKKRGASGMVVCSGIGEYFNTSPIHPSAERYPEKSVYMNYPETKGAYRIYSNGVVHKVDPVTGQHWLTDLRRGDLN